MYCMEQKTINTPEECFSSARPGALRAFLSLLLEHSALVGLICGIARLSEENDIHLLGLRGGVGDGYESGSIMAEIDRSDMFLLQPEEISIF